MRTSYRLTSEMKMILTVVLLVVLGQAPHLLSYPICDLPDSASSYDETAFCRYSRISGSDL